MNIPPSEARGMSLWEYEATLTCHNRAMDPEGDLEVVTAEQFRDTEQFFSDNPHLLH